MPMAFSTIRTSTDLNWPRLSRLN